ncbi:MULTISPECIES: acyl-CoA desaturase [unclassified Sphingomonas]|uniref:acyl-CoA desaturase n=1 Tax=unclassified Sphingomonas TaxID=196159 RepID=UPI00286B057F|nr:MULTISPECIES: acyl-CoA desaturase [unclassified Sphingomonas]
MPSSAPPVIGGVTPLGPKAARIKSLVALAVMLVPLMGAIEAVRLWMTEQARPVDIVLFALFYTIQMFGISMGYHRYLAHRAFKTSRLVRGLLLIAGSMAAQGPILFWVTTHRRHHAYSDRPGDPHSPNLLGDDRWSRAKGLWHAHMPWMLAPDMSSWTYFAPDILRDRQLFFYDRTYLLWVLTGLALPAAVGGIVSGDLHGAWNGLVFGGLARIFWANQFAWCVGSICHRFGSRPFATGDHSTNNWLIAILTFGEGLQNNHHAFPASYRHGVHWWEPDLSGWMLALMGRLKLVSELRSPTPTTVARTTRSHQQR